MRRPALPTALAVALLALMPAGCLHGGPPAPPRPASALVLQPGDLGPGWAMKAAQPRTLQEPGFRDGFVTSFFPDSPQAPAQFIESDAFTFADAAAAHADVLMARNATAPKDAAPRAIGDEAAAWTAGNESTLLLRRGAVRWTLVTDEQGRPGDLALGDLAAKLVAKADAP